MYGINYHRSVYMLCSSVDMFKNIIYNIYIQVSS